MRTRKYITYAAALLAFTGTPAALYLYSEQEMPGGSLREDVLAALGGPGEPQADIREALAMESTIRSLRAKKAVLSRREEILRYQLRLLEAESERADSSVRPRLREEMRKSRNMLVMLLKDQQETDERFTEYLKQMWEAEGRVRVATMGMNGGDVTILISWPVEPDNGISAGFKDHGYEEMFGLEHNAVDIPVLQGTEIRAAADGVVETVADNGMGYNYVILMHNGYATLYGHVISFTVEEGQEVREGDVIGLSGGRPGTPGAGAISTGPHVHFEVIAGGQHVDPLVHLPYVAGLEVADGSAD